MNSRTLPSALPDFLDALSHRVSGELRIDAYSQTLYATDASIYRVPPYGVLIPRDADDVQAAVEASAEYGIPILARGAGSSLAGQAVNTALVIDMSRHLDRILEVNREEAWVRVQPGVVLDELNLALAASGLMFGPDPASSNRATMGGIVSNNSTGSHSIVYGMTADHVLAAGVFLGDGTQADLRALDDRTLLLKLEEEGLEADIYRAVDRVRREGEDVIRRGTPRHWRRCGGYNLDRFVPPVPAGEGATSPSFLLPKRPGFNLAELICGAEGTLAVMHEIKLNLVARPAMTALAVVHFDSLHAALSAVPEILETEPSAVELLDHLGLTRSREVPAYARLLDTFIDGDPNCVLITEFTGDSETELRSKIAALRKRRIGVRTVDLYAPEDQAQVWQVRKVALGFLMSIKGDFKPVPFIEDAAVPVEHLAEYIARIEEFCDALGTEIGYYAHASAGCLHVRPLINTKDAREIAKMPEILSFSAELLGEHGGALSSEHGDGRARSWANEAFFGKDLYGLFRETKTAFDPQNILNPGNVVDAAPMTEGLRYGPDYATRPLRERVDFSADFGFAGAIEMCNGAAICRKKTAGTMCPSFMVTREEEHSTRGRANALRAALSGDLPVEELTSKRMYDVMDLCIECKACKSECPSGVDMARIKFEFLTQYHEKNRPSLRSRVFAGIAGTSRLAAGPLAPLANALLDSTPVKWGLDRFLGISRRRALPAFSRRPFRAGPGAKGEVRRFLGAGSPPTVQPGGRPVVLFADTVNNYNHPGTLQAAQGVLEAAGFEVLVHAGTCCGRPYISKGLHAGAVRAAEATVRGLQTYVKEGIPVVGLEPSCMSAIMDDYLTLIPREPAVGAVAAGVQNFDAFIVGLAEKGELELKFTPGPGEILLHGHCHQKALFGTEATRRMLGLTGAEVREVDSGCCGMAGSFGYESEHYEISMQMGERQLFPAVRAHSGTIAAPGVSCRSQIAHGAGADALHPVEILYRSLVVGA